MSHYTETIEARRAANAAAYHIKTKRSKDARLIHNVIAIGLMAMALGGIIQAHTDAKAIKSITAEQQMQASQHADDRNWYQRECEQIASADGKSVWVECKPNPELAK